VCPPVDSTNSLQDEASLPIIVLRDWLLQRIQPKMMRHLMIEPENRGDGFGIANRASEHHANRGGQRNQPFLDHFVGLGLRLPGPKAGGQIHGHSFGDEAGAGIKVKDTAPMRSSVSSFFKEFALGGVEGLLAGVDASGRKLPKIVAGCVPILTLQKHARSGPRIIDCQNDDGAAVMNNVAAGAHAAGFLNVVGGDPKNWTTIDGSGGNRPRFRKQIVFAGPGRF